MPQLKAIAQLGEPVLRLTAQGIQQFDTGSVRSLMADMLHTLNESGGVGLAAPQVHESVRMIIVASRPTPRYPHAPEMPATIMINPEFCVLSEALEKDWEGCLSIPGIRALIPRHQNIGVTFTDAEGLLQQLELQGFPARVLQHEIDHLDGLVYLDRVENNRDIISETEFFKLHAPSKI
ncbi:MAG: peptide deformylase [Methylococcaceae bacterium]|nr:peptide deformylase [Methylococcaceae bacterium]